ncbi:GNAT family N-acetyltransferase [Ideonella sp. BN130291]|uniref:GNAT family N-acetyltransferase n=1 Tax=Ideonella sp. BN130291 TaxID=3112940 RepID=UPI002E25A771|nr:GNAT family N-acetyltransferase [Ideonella sp. BN130291]
MRVTFRVIHTERLRLRRMHTGDAAFMLALLNQPSFIRNIGDRGARDLAGARAYITDRVRAAYDRHGFGMYVVELKASGEPVGICGLVKRDSLPEVDIGYALLERHWGRGYALEAGRAVLAHAPNDIGLQRLLAITAPDNLPSMALLEKLGLRYQRLMQLPEGDSALFSLDF